MIDYGLSMTDVRRDLLQWPRGRSIRESYEPNVFEPTTMAVVAEWLADVPRALALVALAETADWTKEAANELVDLVDEWRARNNAVVAAVDEEAHAAHTIRAHARKASKKRLENERKAGTPPQLQKLVLEAEDVCGRGAASSVIADHLQARGRTSTTTSNVGKARRALRAKGL